MMGAAFPTPQMEKKDQPATNAAHVRSSLAASAGKLVFLSKDFDKLWASGTPGSRVSY